MEKCDKKSVAEPKFGRNLCEFDVVQYPTWLLSPSATAEREKSLTPESAG
jgi:hypothetical protein